MAVYTQLSTAEIQHLADQLDIGRVIAATGVTAGVENSTYFLETLTSENIPREYVLTVAETLSIEDLRFTAKLCTHLSERNLPVSAPLSDATGASVFVIGGKPAIVFPKITGAHPEHPTIAQCKLLGNTLGRLHLATQTLAIQHPSHRSLDWVAAMGNRLIHCLNRADQDLLVAELRFSSKLVSANNHLPEATIHGDLFRDNTLFYKEELVAIIDFFSAGSGFLLLDLAIATNDWCRAGEEISLPHLHALTGGYAAIRPLDPPEMEAWPQLLRVAALRFWVSRLTEHYLGDHQRPPGHGKNPEEYRTLLLHHRDNPHGWAA